ncbi:MAG: FAD-binding oxidoreductase [Pseudomonadota bacterium]
MSGEVVRPAASWELAGILADAAAERRSVQIVGAATKAAVGNAGSVDLTVQTLGLRGIQNYDAHSGLIEAHAGTTLDELQSELTRLGRMLPSDIADLGPLFGYPAGSGTLGGMAGAGLPGPRAAAVGPLARQVRNFSVVLGDGREQSFGGEGAQSSAETGLAGAVFGGWGRYGVLVRVRFQTDPLPETTASLAVRGLTDDIAVDAIADALKSAPVVSGAVHLDASLAVRTPTLGGLGQTGEPVTLVRLEGRVDAMADTLARMQVALAAYGAADALDDATSRQIWAEIASLQVFAGSGEPLWRVAVPASALASVLATIRRVFDARVMIDNAGRAAWIELPFAADAGVTEVRRSLANFGGLATLVRAAPDIRAGTRCFQLMSPGLERIAAAARRVFDPAGILSMDGRHVGA